MTTTASASQPPRDRALGRRVSTLIPSSTAQTPADLAAAALAAVRTIPVQTGLLQAAVVLLEEMERTTGDENTRSTAAATVQLLRTAVAGSPDPVQ
ncbi:hypothetical protein [Streptomyces sp. NPDC094049]|uniref:hypothetical protein n=1 Tax=Streptomyces sp. NPDC094049 TaxID=3154987 RepID=UPI0033232F74